MKTARHLLVTGCFSSLMLLLDFLHQRSYLRIFPGNIGIILFSVRQDTGRTILSAFFVISEISSAPLSEDIQRTVTEQAIKILRIRPRMARIKLAFPVREKCILSRGFFSVHSLYKPADRGDRTIGSVVADDDAIRRIGGVYDLSIAHINCHMTAIADQVSRLSF